MIVHDSSSVCVDEVHLGLASKCQYLIFYQTVYVMSFTHKSNIVRDIVRWDKNIFVLAARQVFSNLSVLNIDILRALIDALIFKI